MKIFYSFLIIVAGIILLLLPITQGIYDFRTDQKTDTVTVTTGAGVTTSNVTLSKFLYDSDTAHVVFTSSIAETPTVSTYNGTTKALEVTGLTAATSRTLGITYPVSALLGFSSFDVLMNITPFIWYILVVALMIAGLLAVFLK